MRFYKKKLNNLYQYKIKIINKNNSFSKNFKFKIDSNNTLKDINILILKFRNIFILF